MSKEDYWKRELAEIVDRHNERHKDREKVVSHATRSARRQGIFRIFVLLHQLGFRARPRNFSGNRPHEERRQVTAQLVERRGRRRLPCTAVRLRP